MDNGHKIYKHLMPLWGNLHSNLFFFVQEVKLLSLIYFIGFSQIMSNFREGNYSCGESGPEYICQNENSGIKYKNGRDVYLN